MAQNLYGTQVQPRPGSASIGYGPAGQVYDPSNPVVMTTSGVRPASVVAASQRQMAQPQAPIPQRRPYAWTAAGKQLSAQEQSLFGNDLYNHPAATGSPTPSQGQGGAGGTGINVSTGINAALPMGATSASTQAMLRSAGVPLSGAQIGDLTDQYGGLTRSLLSRDAVDLSRLGSFMEANSFNAMEQARANAGIGWGDIGAGFNALDIQDLLGNLGLYNDRLRLASALFN